MSRVIGKLLLSVAIGTLGLLSTGLLSARAADTKDSAIPGGIEGKIVKVDVDKGSVTIAGDNMRERTFAITDQTTIVGPRGGVVHKRLKDRRFHPGLSVTVVATGSTATQLHLGYDRKSSKATDATSQPAPTDQPTPTKTTRTTRYRARTDAAKADAATDTAKSEEADDEDNEFPGKVKSADATKRMLVITLLNGKDRSFLLSNDVKITVNGRASTRGLSDSAIKVGIPVTVVTETGGRKVKEVKVTPATSRRMKKAS